MKIYTYHSFPDRIDIETTHPMISKILETKGYYTTLSGLYEMFPSTYKKAWFTRHLYDKKLMFYLKFIDG